MSNNELLTRLESKLESIDINNSARADWADNAYHLAKSLKKK